MDYQATEKLLVNASFTYNTAEDSWNWNFNDRPQLIWMGAAKPNYDNTNDYNDLIDSYSDLSYEQYEVSLGGTYNFSEALYTTASVTYSDFDAKEEFVYGDESGSAVYSYVGVGYRF
jgi:predicted porin